MKTLFFSILLVLSFPADLFADGFSLERALKKHRHLILKLSPSQIEAVGQLRRLDLTKEQLQLIQQHGVKSPQTLGVMSAWEPDCGCCIAPAYWLKKDQVVIWLDHLKQIKNGGKWYYTVRLEPGRYVIASEDRIFHNGSPVSLKEFEKAVSAPREATQRIQISLAPDTSEKLIAKLRDLQKKSNYFGFRL